MVQGRFKQQLPYDDVFTGQEFFRPLLDMPAKWMINVLLRIARKLSPSSIFGLLDAPHILTPLVAGAQNIHITPVRGRGSLIIIAATLPSPLQHSHPSFASGLHPACHSHAVTL